jgi:tellurite resistance protein
MGIFFWLSIESIIMNRLYKFKLEEEYQNTLGIMMAPPAIAALSWMSLHNNKFDLFTMVLLGYGLIQVLIFIKTLFLLIKRPFNLSYWAFSFGFTTLTNVALLTLQDKNTVLIKIICCSLVVITNIALFYLIFNSLKHLYKNNIPNKFKNELQ